MDDDLTVRTKTTLAMLHATMRCIEDLPASEDLTWAQTHMERARRSVQQWIASPESGLAGKLELTDVSFPVPLELQGGRTMTAPAMRGKFRLIDLTAQRAYVSPRGRETKPTIMPSVRVKLQAVSGSNSPPSEDGRYQEEDSLFAVATPYGVAEMTITNPEVCRYLTDLWTAFIKSDDVEDLGPTFYLDFTPV